MLPACARTRSVFSPLTWSLDRPALRPPPRNVSLFGNIGRERRPIGLRNFLQSGSGHRVTLLSVPNFQALPPEKACIDRPHARSDQREGDPQGPDRHQTPAIFRPRERVPKRGESQERAADWGPQADDEKRAHTDAKRMQQRRPEGRCTTQAADRTGNHCDSGYEADQ